MSPKYQIKTFYEIDQNLIKEWESLWINAVNATIFNSYPWFKATSKTKQLHKCVIYLCYQNDELVAILPLVEEKRFGIKVLTTHLGSYISDEAILLKEYNAQLLKELIVEISKDNNLYLTRVSSTNVQDLKNIFPQIFFSVIGVNPIINLKGDPLSSFSKSSRKKLESILKKAGDMMVLRTFSEDDNLNELLKVMIDIDTNSGKQRNSRDIFTKEEEKRFFANLINYCRKYIEISILYYNDKPIAYTFNLKGGKVYFGYQTSYLFEYRKLSPGKLVLMKSLKEIAHSGYNLLDCGEGLSAFKQEFTKDYKLKYDLHYSRNSLVMFWWKSIIFARRLKQILMPEKNSRDYEFLFTTNLKG